MLDDLVYVLSEKSLNRWSMIARVKASWSAATSAKVAVRSKLRALRQSTMPVAAPAWRTRSSNEASADAAVAGAVISWGSQRRDGCKEMGCGKSDQPRVCQNRPCRY